MSKKYTVQVIVKDEAGLVCESIERTYSVELEARDEDEADAIDDLISKIECVAEDWESERE